MVIKSKSYWEEESEITEKNRATAMLDANPAVIICRADLFAARKMQNQRNVPELIKICIYL